MKTITVLSHNVFWFQGMPFAGDSPPAPDPVCMGALCEFYRAVSPDLLCLQEVQSVTAFEEAGLRLGMEGTYCPGRQLPQYGGAVYWKPGVARKIRDSAEDDFPVQRMWQIVEIQKADGGVVPVANVHLPSARQLGREKAGIQRVRELEEAVLHGAPSPEVLVGDLNELPGQAVGAALERKGFKDAAVLFGADEFATRVKGGRGDYIWVTPQAGALSYKVTGRGKLVAAKEGKEFLSDHLPLWITLET